MKSAFALLAALLVATASAQCDVQSLISTNEGYATCVCTSIFPILIFNVGKRLCFCLGERDSSPSVETHNCATSLFLRPFLLRSFGSPTAKSFSPSRTCIVAHSTADTDTTGNPTIGIGFNLNKAGAAQLIAGQGYDYNSIVAGTTCLSDAAVVALFQNDVANAQACAQKTAPFFGNLRPNAQSVVVDLIFNLGCSGYSSFTGFNNFLANGDYAGAANDLQTQTRWCGQVGTRYVFLVFCSG
jgi:GH24 family phage-related lysozyme (muramidase)